MKSKLLLFACISLLVFSPVQGMTGTIVITPTADTSIFEGIPGNNTGATTQIPVGKVATGRQTRMLIRFDLGNQIPSGARVTRVALRLHAVRQNGADGSRLNIGVHRLLVPWIEGIQGKNDLGGNPAADGEPTWNHLASPHTAWGTPGGSPGADYASVAGATAQVGALGSYTIESSTGLLDDVNQWLTHPESNFGWILIGSNLDAAGTARRFTSREGTPDQAPALILEYETAEVELRILGIQAVGAEVRIDWSDSGAGLYQVEGRQDLSGNSVWEPVGPPTPGTTSRIPLQGTQRYIRVVKVPPVAG